MKNRPGSNNLLTDWEDEIHFDADDPDFCNAPPPPPPSTAQTSGNALTAANAPTIVVGDSGEGLPSFTFKVPSNMSLASVHGPQFADFCSPLGRNSISMSSSLSDLVGSPLEISAENVLTIEELRTHMGSCFTCGVSWTDDHVSLDCAECGGYSMEHPCPLCDGKCGVQWKRDFTMSHACGKARWQGVCPSFPEATMHLNSQLSVAGADTMSMTAAATSSNNNNNSNNSNTTQATCAAASNQLRLAQELCARLEQLSASTHI